MSDAIFQKVTELIAARVNIPAENISLDSNFRELGIDSLAALSLIYDLEDEYGIEIPNEDAMNVQTVRQIVESLVKLGAS